MTEQDANAILPLLAELRSKITTLREERDEWKRTAQRRQGSILDLENRVSDLLVERDALRVQLDEAQTLSDQYQEAAESRRYGRELP